MQQLPLGFLHLLHRRLRALHAAAKGLEVHDLAKQGEVRFVRQQREHDEIGVETVHHVASVGVVPGSLQIDRQTDRQTDRQIDRQTDRQTDR